MSDLDAEMSLKGKSSKTPLIIGVVVVVGGIGWFAFSAVQQRNERKLHATAMEDFRQIERGDVAKFWECVLGPNVDPGTLPNNVALEQRIESAFNLDVKTYPDKVKNECTPKVLDAKKKVDSLSMPAVYGDAVKAYGKSLEQLASAFSAWAEIAPQQIAEKEVAKKMNDGGNAYHAFQGGTPAPDVLAYDHFLHCAVPVVDSMKDDMEVAKYIWEQCKSPAYMAKLETECGKELTSPQMTPTAGFKATLKKIQAEDREQQGLEDCLRKNRKGKRKDDLNGVDQAWKTYMDAGAGVRKIGKEALKNG